MRVLFRRTSLKVEDVYPTDVEQRSEAANHLDAISVLDDEKRYITLEEFLMNAYKYEMCSMINHERPEFYIEQLMECVKVGLVEINMCFGPTFDDKYKKLEKDYPLGSKHEPVASN